MGKLSPFQTINFALALCFITVREKSKNLTIFIPAEIYKWDAVQVGIHHGSSDSKISKCLGINLKSDSYKYL